MSQKFTFMSEVFEEGEAGNTWTLPEFPPAVSGVLTIADIHTPINFVFHGKANKPLFIVKPDGTIERGPAFTTTDAASLEFWDALQRMGLQIGKP